ncbi:Zinc finger protein 324a [Plakobranchus ocellatus]|uniref:Zinc finger protein 324a n=1 Tax=Plakobranchus ocellatus TaxID=259542 RepID=A0AAV3YDP3_9GAST|nr:Zinc finger protein 324a [Plakobranchus ocellatus]
MTHPYPYPEKDDRTFAVNVDNVCITCNMYFQVPSNFQDHMANFHKKSMPYVCSLCGKCYGSTSGLFLHMQAHDGKTFVCPVCDSKFSQNSTMKRHMKSVHKTNQCSVCKGIFKLGLEFDKHILHCKD